jgi:hypothetical protein
MNHRRPLRGHDIVPSIVAAGSVPLALIVSSHLLALIALVLILHLRPCSSC